MNNYKELSIPGSFFFVNRVIGNDLYQNIDGGNSFDRITNVGSRLATSKRTPLKRNDRIRYTGRIDEKSLERVERIGSRVRIVPKTNAKRVTKAV